ncbi:DUF4232 domain-containing protein [Streptomyces avidinii]|uniref:DUF4232 domain-containing protein n=1 Tax=Streptomyces avidinii TaxID=1895 RepID=A0ABS4KZ15_STRAV|nr:DUF4232 domain-containing protein [Streptomyces avidinii]MBP2035277.1 hypothetical protein [Streptomyces avidinii]GGZ03587.1 hypothetical protein GCM10010343_31800 [Streptomyces avidinii]
MIASRSTSTPTGTRTFRPRAVRRLATASAVALAALALTACQDGTGIRDEGAAAVTGSAAATPPTADGATGTQGTTGGQQGTTATPAPGSASTTGGGKNGTDPAKEKGSAEPPAAGERVLCNGSNTAVTVQPVSRPLNHMLITVKNTGSKVCDLTYHPVLRFDEMQWAPAARQETRPQAVVSLAPGESGYAAAILAAADGSGEGGTTGHRLTIAFQGRTPNSGGGASAIPPLPTQGVHYDSSLTVTYWQQDIEDALGS